MEELLKEIKSCTVCEKHLEWGINPIISASTESRIIIIGQAPGRLVHNTGIPWNDKSGKNLRSWLNISEEVFYDSGKIALIPMSFCYPGTGKTGDLPPRKECAPLWHYKLMSLIKNAKLTILVGQFAQNYYLKDKMLTLTETVKNYNSYLPQYFPLPHPSPRNNIWQAKNKWFNQEVLPVLKETVKNIFEEET